MEQYLNSYNTLDISDFIKRYYAHVRHDATTNNDYINFVQNRPTTMKYIEKPILYRSYNDPIHDQQSYVMTVHNIAMKKISKSCVLRQILMRSRIKDLHTALGIQIPNIENKILC